jgi:hypothetical protein
MNFSGFSFIVPTWLKGAREAQMKVFISWSGDRSKQLAEAIHWWLPNVMQFVKPYFTPADIDKGRKTDLKGPLASFQAIEFNKHEVRQLLTTINKAAKEAALLERTLDEAFNKWWDDLEEKVQAILSTQPPTEPQRSAEDLLEEAVSNTRAILRELQAPRPLQVFAPNREMEAFVRALMPQRGLGAALAGDEATAEMAGRAAALADLVRPKVRVMLSLSRCPSTGSSTATTIRFRLSSNLGLHPFMLVCVGGREPFTVLRTSAARSREA